MAAIAPVSGVADDDRPFERPLGRRYGELINIPPPTLDTRTSRTVKNPVKLGNTDKNKRTTPPIQHRPVKHPVECSSTIL